MISKIAVAITNIALSGSLQAEKYSEGKKLLDLDSMYEGTGLMFGLHKDELKKGLK